MWVWVLGPTPKGPLLDMEACHAHPFLPVSSVPSCTGETGKLKHFPYSLPATALDVKLGSANRWLAWEFHGRHETEAMSLLFLDVCCWQGSSWRCQCLVSRNVGVGKDLQHWWQPESPLSCWIISSVTIKRQLRKVANIFCAPYPGSFQLPASRSHGYSGVLKLQVAVEPPECAKPVLSLVVLSLIVLVVQLLNNLSVRK